MAQAFGVVEPVLMDTIRCFSASAISMVALVAHTLGKVLKVCMATVGDDARLTTRSSCYGFSSSCSLC